jgi:uncharacterized membrane-anchored protein
VRETNPWDVNERDDRSASRNAARRLPDPWDTGQWFARPAPGSRSDYPHPSDYSGRRDYDERDMYSVPGRRDYQEPWDEPPPSRRNRQDRWDEDEWDDYPEPGGIGRFFPEPLAAKVPEITLMFWVVKLLTTAGGEAVSDYLALGNRLVGAGLEGVILVIALLWQFRTRRYSAAAYWFLAYAIAIFGTGVSDTLHLFVGLPYVATTLLWATVLAGIFWVWYRNEGTLSIHSIVTRRRETYYWATVFATFALGTALGDLTAISLHLGYLASGVLFFIVIMIPALAWSSFRLNPVIAFWSAYVDTRPLGASFADYAGKSKHLSGLGFGELQTAVAATIAVAVLVTGLAITRHGIQEPRELEEPGDWPPDDREARQAGSHRARW